MTKAAVRAVSDAVSRVCLCGIMEICGRDTLQGVYVHAEVAVPDPTRVDKRKVLACIPIGETSLRLNSGGLSVPGIEVPRFASGVTDIVAACAALTVSIEMDEAGEGNKVSKNQACGCAAKAE